jgi:hypothetical protein
MAVNRTGTKITPFTQRQNRQAEAVTAARMLELRTGPEKMTLAAIADEMECSIFKVQRLLNKYTPKLLESDATKHREIEVQKLDLLEEKLWGLLDEEYYTVSSGQVVYMETGDPVPDIDPVMKVIDRILRVSERRSKLLGLDKPVRVEATIHQVDSADMELAQMIREGRAKSDGNHSRG